MIFRYGNIGNIIIIQKGGVVNENVESEVKEMKKMIWQIINIGGQILFFIVNFVLLLCLVSSILSTSNIKVGDKEYKRVGTVNIYSTDCIYSVQQDSEGKIVISEVK